MGSQPRELGFGSGLVEWTGHDARVTEWWMCVEWEAYTMMDGVYVVSELHVENTANVET